MIVELYDRDNLKRIIDMAHIYTDGWNSQWIIVDINKVQHVLLNGWHGVIGNRYRITNNVAYMEKI